MRRDCTHFLPLIAILLLFSTLSYGQAWSGGLSASRAIDWGNAGLQATFPDGETTTNPWTPPVRTTICTTLTPIGGGANDEPQILSAVASCGNGTVVVLGPAPASAPFTISSNFLWSPGYTSGHNNVTIRGSGPMSTYINLNAVTFQIGVSSAAGSGRLTSASSNYTVGNNSVVITTGSPPSVGMLAFFNQCDTGATWNGSSCVGPDVDNGGLFVCNFDAPCESGSGLTPSFGSQNQYVTITSVTNSGSGTYTIGFTPGLYENNWSYAQAAQLNWFSSTYTGIGLGLEDLTVVLQSGQNESIALNGCYDCWIKGVRVVGSSVTQSISLSSTNHCLVSNNYVFGQSKAITSGFHMDITEGSDSDDLILNNILTAGGPIEGEGSDTGNVFAYNYNRDVANILQSEIRHVGESSLFLREANQQDISQDDDTWGTHHFNTWFRDYYAGSDVPYVPTTVNARSIEIGNFARSENVIGNILGGPLTTLGYQTSTANSGYIFITPPSDALSLASLMRWGNCDTYTGTCRFNSSEVPNSTNMPSGTYPNAVAFLNSTPSNNNLPCSFFLAGYTSTTCTPHPNGGTGLSWWKVCKTWNTFPTSCATTQTQPFPPIGPDVTGGPYTAGTGSAYDLPAAVAQSNLPIDTTYQSSYAISSFSWSGGTETLTFAGGVLPSNITHLLGGFQISGATGSCNSSAGTEFLMTGSTSTTVTYATANPGSCSGGSMLFPDVRQFDERVYQDDGSSVNQPNPPTGLAAIVN